MHPGGLDCVLCSLRGGPLKRTRDGCWVHVFCYLALTPAADSSSSSSSAFAIGDSDAARVPASSYDRTCRLCADVADFANASHAKRGACVACSDLTCHTFFHPTCALLSDKVRIETLVAKIEGGGGFAVSFEFRCDSVHAAERDFNSTSTSSDLMDDSVDGAMPLSPRGTVDGDDVVVGQTIIAPFKGDKYCPARVLNLRAKNFYKIYFDDGTISR